MLYVFGILFAILAGFCAVIALVSFIGYKLNADASQRVEGWRFTILCTFAICCCVFFFFAKGALAKSNETELTVKAIQENADDWTFFLDGEEVVYENIDINQYNISWNEESHKVFLTKK